MPGAGFPSLLPQVAPQPPEADRENLQSLQPVSNVFGYYCLSNHYLCFFRKREYLASASIDAYGLFINLKKNYAEYYKNISWIT
jgi:hypothetical protein